MSLDPLSNMLPAPPVAQDSNAKAIVPAVSASASSDRGSVPRRVEAFEAAVTPNKMGVASTHVDDRV